jgi:hypothetical protein
MVCAALIFFTITIHVAGLFLIAIVIRRFWEREVIGTRSLLYTIPGAVSVIIGIALALAVLHGVESLIWYRLRAPRSADIDA